jgi:rhamnosyltransferase
MKTASIVVTYFPDEKFLRQLLICISKETTNVYVVDNTPAADVSWLNKVWVSSLDINISYDALGDNFGIAKAQNIGIGYAVRDGCSNVVFFDQDSEPPPGMITRLIRAEARLLSLGFKVGSVGPLFCDAKTKHYAPAIRHYGVFTQRVKVIPYENEEVRADYLISSGSLIRLCVLEEVGSMRVELFIDWVDIEWGMRAGRYGYEHFIIPDAIMLHSIGDQFISVGKREINLHNDVRNFYIVRNACNLFLDKSINWRWRANIFFKIPAYVIFFSLSSLSKRRFKTLLLLLRACTHGFMGRLGKAF